MTPPQRQLMSDGTLPATHGGRTPVAESAELERRREDAEAFARGALAALRLAEQRLVGSLRSFAKLQERRLADLEKAEAHARYACELSTARGAERRPPDPALERIARTRGEHYRTAVDALRQIGRAFATQPNTQEPG
jgi:hypothetical protein